MQYKCEAIVLKSFKLGESDLILSLYSPEKGLIKAVAKSARKMKNSFGAKAQVLSHSEFLIAKGKNLDIISQSKLKDDFRNLRTDYDTLTLACYFADLLETIAIEDNNYEDHFDLILSVLKELDSNDSKASNHIALEYLWDLIDQLGYKPELETCSISQIKKPQERAAQYFDFKNGSITSTNSYNEHIIKNPYQDEIKLISPDAYRVLQALDLNRFLRETAANDVKSAMKLLNTHLEYQIHKPIKSWKLVSEILN